MRVFLVPLNLRVHQSMGRVSPLITFLLILSVWWIVGELGCVNQLFFPLLPNLLRETWGLLGETEIYCNLIMTLYRSLSGLFFSIIFGVPLGLYFGRNLSVYRYFELPIDFFRSIPSSALFFLFILLFGIGELSKIAVVFYGCFLIILVSAVYGAKPNKEKQDRVNMLKSFGASPLQVFYMTILPDALPHILAGMRVCISLSLVLVIVTEMFLGASSGLGAQLYDYYLAYEIEKMWAVIILLGFLGFTLNQFGFLIEKYFTFWKPSEEYQY